MLYDATNAIDLVTELLGKALRGAAYGLTNGGSYNSHKLRPTKLVANNGRLKASLSQLHGAAGHMKNALGSFVQRGKIAKPPKARNTLPAPVGSVPSMNSVTRTPQMASRSHVGNMKYAKTPNGMEGFVGPNPHLAQAYRRNKQNAVRIAQGIGKSPVAQITVPRHPALNVAAFGARRGSSTRRKFKAAGKVTSLLTNAGHVHVHVPRANAITAYAVAKKRGVARKGFTGVRQYGPAFTDFTQPTSSGVRPKGVRPALKARVKTQERVTKTQLKRQSTRTRKHATPRPSKIGQRVDVRAGTRHTKMGKVAQVKAHKRLVVKHKRK